MKFRRCQQLEPKFLRLWPRCEPGPDSRPGTAQEPVHHAGHGEMEIEQTDRQTCGAHICRLAGRPGRRVVGPWKRKGADPPALPTGPRDLSTGEATSRATHPTCDPTEPAHRNRGDRPRRYFIVRTLAASQPSRRPGVEPACRGSRAVRSTAVARKFLTMKYLRGRSLPFSPRVGSMRWQIGFVSRNLPAAGRTCPWPTRGRTWRQPRFERRETPGRRDN